MKATQLEQIESHYALIQEQKTITEDKISMKEEGLPDLEKDALEKEQRFKDIESLNTLREKREKLLKVLAWAHVTEIEQVRAQQKRCGKEEALSLWLYLQASHTPLTCPPCPCPASAPWSIYI